MDVLDILYTPLDTAPMPDFDINELRVWLGDTYAIQSKEIRNILDDRVNSTESIVKDRYPWNLTIGYSNMEDSGPGWINGFDKKFPQLAVWLFEAYGLNTEDVGSVLFFPVRQGHTGFGFWHNDPDSVGMRVYLEFEDSDTNKLFMRRFKEKYDTRTLFPHPLDIAKTCKPELLEAKLLSPRQCFYLNNVRAVHATYTEIPNKTRIACFVTPNKLRTKNFVDKVVPLVIRSAQKYKEYALLWE